jgi:hypothetical protein
MRTRSGYDATKIWRDASAAVVADEIDPVDTEGVEKLLEHDGIGGHRHVLFRRDLGAAVREQVDRDATPDIREMGELVPPEMAVQQDPVNEQRHRALSLFEIADPSGRR